MKLPETQQAVIDKMRAGAALTSVSLGRRSGAALQLPNQKAERISLITLRALSKRGAIMLAGKRGCHASWKLPN